MAFMAKFSRVAKRNTWGRNGKKRVAPGRCRCGAGGGYLVLATRIHFSQYRDRKTPAGNS